MTHRRLLETHELWHQTAENYLNPDSFRTYLNATIQALRNVTFAVQSEKSSFEDFDAWYGPWQTRMKASRVLKWARDARNRVVKQTDLDTVSTAVIRLLTWNDTELTRISVDPRTSSEVLLNQVPIMTLVARASVPTVDVEGAVLEVERQWRLPGFHNRDVLDVLAAAYGVLSDLVVDGHAHLKSLECIDRTVPHSPFRAVHHRSGTLPCMIATEEHRKERFSLSTGHRIVSDSVRKSTDRASIESAAARYGMTATNSPALQRGADPDTAAKRLLYWAKRLLRKDRYHIRVVFVRDGSGEWHPIGLDLADRGAKHLAMRMVARFVERTGADAIIDIGEVWYSKAQRDQITQQWSVDDAPRRAEALQVLVATRAGLLRVYFTPFSRGRLGGIRLGDTRVTDEDPRNRRYLHPLFKIWAVQGVRSGPDEKPVTWLWEPDPLDDCYCGGETQFGACCQRLLQQRTMEELQDQRQDALKRSDFADAERFARAELAQYVIWIRRHTVVAIQIGWDRHEDLVEIDVAALEAHVRQLERILDFNDRRIELVRRVQKIHEAVWIPEVRARLVALAAEILYEIGSRVDAAAELDQLGDLESVADPKALWVAARVFENDHEDCCRLLEKGIVNAENEHDRCAMELDLANAYQRCGKKTQAVDTIDLVIARTQGTDLVGPRAAAMDLRWRITGSATDFCSARRELEGRRDSHSRRRLLVMLVDHCDFEESEEILAEPENRDSVGAQLLGIEIRLKTDRIEEAEELARVLPTERITGRLRLQYAYTIGSVAVRCRNIDLAETAAGMLRCIHTEDGGLQSEYDALLDALESVRVAPGE